MNKIKYSTPTAFRRALEDRLTQIAKKDGIEIQRLRRQVAFDRLLARLFMDGKTPWVLKGGYAMQLRIDNARATKDVDLSLRELKLKTKNKDEQYKVVLEILQENAQRDLNDFFIFVITGPTMDMDSAPYGGARYHVEAQVDDRSFEKFQIDIGIGDHWMEPHEKLETRAWLPAAGLTSQIFPAIPKEQQFAEKLHAYTLPRADRPNSRVKDLIDMLLLIEGDELNEITLIQAIHETYKRRSTHEFSKTIAAPPVAWGATFTSMAISTGLPTDNLDKGFETVFGYMKKLPLK
jgi:hypothetical protein